MWEATRLQNPPSSVAGAMGRFNKAKAPAAASTAGGSSGPKPVLTPLSELAKMQPLPLSLVSTMARVTYIFGYTPGNLASLLWEGLWVAV